MSQYTVRIDGLDDATTVDREEDYDIGERILLAEVEGDVICDVNGEEVGRSFPRPVYGTVIAKNSGS